MVRYHIFRKAVTTDNKGKGVSAGSGTIPHSTSHVSLTMFCSFSSSFLLMGVLPFQDVHLDRRFTTRTEYVTVFVCFALIYIIEVKCVILHTWW